MLEEYNYGYYWWIGKIRGCDLCIAWGMGDQFIFCVPEQDFIVVVTSNPDISWDNNQEYPVLELVSDYILSAI